MKLQLYLNGWLFNEMHLPDVWNRIDSTELSWEDDVTYRNEMLLAHVENMKGIFWNQISKAKTWKIFFVVDSRMNNQEQLYYIKEYLVNK